MKRLTWIVAGVALVVGNAAVGGASGAVVKLEPGDQYVALGTSIASGFGISVQEPGTSCGRSDRSYPKLVAARYELELIDVSCGGAVIPHVTDTPQGVDKPPQIDAVTPGTKLITVTVGGNDISYNATALQCGNPATVCSAPATLDADLATAASELGEMLDALEAKAPKATIVFVTYPREVPRKKNCAELSYTDEEAEVIRSMGKKLQAMFVDVAKRKDIVFVDPYAARGDHTGCAQESQRWTAGNVADDGFAYHPTALGHEAMAKMIFKALKKA